MGRKLLADPELPNKLVEGRTEDIRPCIYCYTCVGKIFTYENTCCAVNPTTGKEAEFEIIPAPKAKKVLVVGSGPAGMEAARVAALRGHKVTLCEKDKHLGGTAYLSTMVNVDNGNLIHYLETQLRKLPIELNLGTEATPEFIQEIKPDVALIAVGHKEELPAIPGIDRKNVYSGNDLRSLMIGGDSDALKRLSFFQRTLVSMGRLVGATRDPAVVRKFSKLWMPMGKRVTIIGGSLVGLELADFFSERGRIVTVLESGAMAPQMAIPRRWRVLHQLRERGVSLLGNVDVKEILANGVAFTTRKGEEQTVESDAVILAVGTVPDHDLLDKVKAHCPEVHLLGDCREVGYIQGAMADGARIGRDI
jgi:NADPH-dependent 2,4-dienoyl-CoA reductase/sulfur reductase-like enzyme